MYEDPHTHCQFSAKSNEELKEICCKAVDEGRIEVAFHTALHHMNLRHAGLTMHKVPFFEEKLPLLCMPAVDVSKTITAEAREAGNRFQDMINSADMPPAVRALGAQITIDTLGAIQSGIRLGYLMGVSMETYARTRGEGCLFSLVDPALCKEES